MSKTNFSNLKSAIGTLNTALSKVKLKSQDIPLEVKTHYQSNVFHNVGQEKSAASLVNPSNIRPPIRKILSEQRARKSLANPSTKLEIDFVKKKFNIPGPVSQKSRHLGNIKYSKPKSIKKNQPTILPRQFRDNPLADPPPITEKDVDSGILSLIHRGLIPKDVDVTPAFERGLPPLQMKMAQFHDWRDMAPPPPPLIGNSSYFPLEKIARLPTSPPAPDLELDTKALIPLIETAKTYEQIIDGFSSHQIVFRKGKIMMTPEFQSFKRINSEQWGTIAQGLSYAEEIFSKLATPLVYLDGKKFVNMIKDELRSIRFEELLDCILNSNTIIPMIKNPIHKFRSPLGKDLAAVKIQASWKRYKAFSAYQQLKILIRKSVVIQNCSRNWRRKLSTRKLIKERENVLVKQHQIIQKNFEKEYSNYKNFSRVEIHICNTDEELSTIINPEVLQSSQISRLFAVKNQLIDVIIITSKILSEEIKNFYYRILEIGGINNPKSRVAFIYPDILNKHTLLIRTSSLLYFSIKTIKQIKSLTEGKKVYIIPSKLNLFDIKISVLLNIPIYSGEYSDIYKYSSKSEVKSLFQQSDLLIPYAEANIVNEKVLYQKLALSIIRYSEVDTWLLKCNREEGSRGIAYFETQSLKIVADIRKSYDLKQACELQDLISEIKTCMGSMIKFVMPTLYRDWSHYLQRFLKHGGIIQAAPVTNKAYMTHPSITFVIQPDGQTDYITSVDNLHSYEFLNAAAFSPQLSLPQEDIINILNALSKTLFNKKLFGYFTLQLVAFIDPYSESIKPMFWAVDLNFGMNRMVSSYLYFHFLMGGALDITTGKYFMQCIEDDLDESEEAGKLGDGNIFHLKNSPRKLTENELFVKLPLAYNGENPVFHDFNLYDTREYLVCWEIWHPDLIGLDLKTFFHMCRYEGISYDLEHGKGITFMIYDLLRYGYIGCMCISSKREILLTLANQVFSFLLQHAGPAPQLQLEYTGKEFRPFSELIAKIRFIEKKQKKEGTRRRVDQAIKDN